VQNQTPQRDAPFADQGLPGPGVTLLYQVGKGVTERAQALTGPSDSSNPTYIAIDFAFGNPSQGPTTIPEGATVTIDPFPGSQAAPNIVAGSGRLDERDQATVTAILSRPPAYIVFNGSNNVGGWLGYEYELGDQATDCLVSNGDVAVIAAWHGDGGRASCQEINSAYSQIL
jgi:hypothetical protein